MPWTMPAEAAPQDRVWMSFPVADSSYSAEDGQDHEEARRVWAEVANAVNRFVPVSMLVDPAERAAASTILDSSIELFEVPLDDCWLRDSGPTFVHAADGSVHAVDWIFNGWGQQDWARWDKDSKLGAFVGERAGVPVIDSPLVNEGGGIVADGNGTVVVTETVQLDPFRNPDLDKAGIERELADKIGARQVVWLKRGLTRDSQRFGTRGHADILVAFPAPDTVLVHTQRDPEHPDFEISREIIETLDNATDADGNPWRIVELPAPEALRDDEGWVDYSYINHLVVNGAVIACSFADPNDDEALAILAAEYPGREIVSIDARPVFARGGGIHCITQQQPSPLPGAED